MSDEGAAPPVAQPQQFVYCCRMCRTRLFEGRQCVPHEKLNRSAECTSYFLDPDQVPWAAIESQKNVEAGGAPLEGPLDTIYCPTPSCRAKLGGRSWHGAQCSCGQWVTPSFRIHAKNVDEFPLQ